MAKAKGKAVKEASKGFASKLSKLDGAWKEAEQNPLAGFVTWEDGKYTARLVSAEVCESENSGRLQVKFGFQNEEVEEEDIHYKFCGLDVENNPDCLRFLHKDITSMGYEPPKNLGKHLEPLLETMVEDSPLVRIQLKTKGEFQNTYINGVVEE
jgi:hypothetical protein